MNKVLSIVLNNFTHDSRVLKECLSLRKAGYDISVLALHDDSENLVEQELVSSIPVHRVRLVSKSWPKIRIVQMVKYFEFIIRAQFFCHKAEILHCNDLNALIVGVIAKVLSLGKLKIVYDAHELECEALARTRMGQKLIELAERVTIHFANQVITVSPSIAEDYARRYGIQKPALVLNAPIWREEIPQGDVFRRQYGIRKEQKIFLYQGGLDYRRAVKELIDAFVDRQKDDAVLIFMGYGPAEEYIRKAAIKHNNIFLHPAVTPDDILEYTCGADYGLIFLHTKGNNSYYYSLPNKFFEYLTCGIPFLANQLHDIGCLNEKYHMGEIVPSMSVEDINRGIDKLLEENYQCLSQNARRMVRKYSWERQEESLISVYEKMVE